MNGLLLLNYKRIYTINFKIMKNLLNNTITDLSEAIINNVFKYLNCVKIGKVIKFYAEDKTADIQIINKIKDEDGNIKDITLLSKCLVVGNKITLPIEEGENVIVLFNDYDLNVFFETGEAQLPYSDRKHDLSDGIVICGLNSLINAIEYDNTAICLNYDTKVNGNLDISKNITIAGNSEITGNNTVTGNNEVKGNNEALTYSTGGVVGISGSFVDSGAGASGKTLTFTNGLITAIN